jgi:hypothetical protein
MRGKGESRLGRRKDTGRHNLLRLFEHSLLIGRPALPQFLGSLARVHILHGVGFATRFCGRTRRLLQTLCRRRFSGASSTADCVSTVSIGGLAPCSCRTNSSSQSAGLSSERNCGLQADRAQLIAVRRNFAAEQLKWPDCQDSAPRRAGRCRLRNGPRAQTGSRAAACRA